MLVITAALMGLLVGATGVLAAWASEREAKSPRGPHPEPSTDSGLDAQVLSLLAAMPGASVILDSELEVLRADAAAFAQGLVRDGKLTVPKIEEVLQKVAANGEAVQDEYLLDSPYGGAASLPMLIRVAPLHGGKLLLTAQDISAARKNEQARRDFTANVSHELKTPVGAISLLAETIENNADNPTAVTEFSARLRRETDRLAALVSDLIELSRLQNPTSLSAAQPVHVGRLARRVLSEYENTAQLRDITLHYYHNGENVQVWGHEDLLATALGNLLENAIRYSTGPAEVTLNLRTHQNTVRLSVVDHGIGIPAEAQQRIFERFYRVDKGRSRAAGGTGLGLSIVKHIISDHRGQIEVESALGQGSTFTLILPVLNPSTEAGEVG